MTLGGQSDLDKLLTVKTDEIWHAQSQETWQIEMRQMKQVDSVVGLPS